MAAFTGTGHAAAAATLGGFAFARLGVSTVVGADSTDLPREEPGRVAFDAATAAGRSTDLAEAVRFARDQIDVAAASSR